MEDAADPDRYQVPASLNTPDVAVENPLYGYRVHSDPFVFQVFRRDTNVIL